jgi:hypothetical protein
MIADALKVRDFLAAAPKRSYRHGAAEFGITKARISQLLKILKALPPDFIVHMAKCQERDKLREFSGKNLLRISRIESPAKRYKETAGKL